MPRWTYSLALRLLVPAAALWFLWRGWRNRAYRVDFRELLALRSQARHDRPLWLHAASVGEVQALAGLVRGMTQMAAPPRLLLTVGTPTGLARARELYRDLLRPQGNERSQMSAVLAPWDLPGVVGRFVKANQPRAAVFIEMEIWPNLLAACERHAVPRVLVSARVSTRSVRRYQRLIPQLMRDAVRAFAIISAQSEVDRQRFIALGADPSLVVVGGNLKFDFPLPVDVAARGAELRAAWASTRPLWVAGSTHPVEEDICIDAQRQLLTSARACGRAMPLLVLAPRRPERFAAVAHWLGGQGLKFARSSEGLMGKVAEIEVLLLDAMGELLPWYAAADVAFVGGSLVPVGGHNLLEPAALGKPVIAGPHCLNSPEAAELLKAAAALTTVVDAAQLSQAVEGLLRNPQLAGASGARAAAVVAANRGVVARALAMIAALPQLR